MAERNSLLELWDLTEADLTLDTDIATSLLNTFITTEQDCAESAKESQSLETFCDNCFAANSEDSNWCIECGTAIIKTPRFYSGGDNYRLPIKEDDKESLQDFTKMTLNLNEDFSDTSELQLQSADAKCDNKIKTSELNPSDIIMDITDIALQQNSASIEEVEWPLVKQCEWFTTHNHKLRKQHIVGNLPLMQEANLLQLPNEVLLAILSYLSHYDLSKCMLVCKHLNLLSKDPSLWRIIKLQKIRNMDAAILKEISFRHPRDLSLIDCHGYISTADIVNFFSSGGQHIEFLNIELVELGPHSTDVFLRSAAKYCNNLKSISVNWICLSAKVIQLCISLNELHVKNKPLSIEALRTLLSCHKYRLVKLDIESTKIEDVVTAFNRNKMPVVEYFSATFSELSNGKMIQQMMAIFPLMKALCACSISHCDDVMKELSSYPLHTLSLKHFGRSINCYFHIREMSTLRHISVDSIDDEGLLILCQGKLQLHSLDLSRSYVTNKCFRIIYEGSFTSLLETIKLNQCDGINDATIEKTVQSFCDSYHPETLAQEILEFIRRCQCLKLMEVHGICCLRELNCEISKLNCKVLL